MLRRACWARSHRLHVKKRRLVCMCVCVCVEGARVYVPNQDGCRREELHCGSPLPGMVFGSARVKGVGARQNKGALRAKLSRVLMGTRKQAGRARIY